MKAKFFLLGALHLFCISNQVKAIAINNLTTEEVSFFDHTIPANSEVTIDDSTLPEFKLERDNYGFLVMKASNAFISSQIHLVKSYDEFEFKAKYDVLNISKLFSENNPEGQLRVAIKPFKKIKDYKNFSKYKKITIEAGKEANSFEVTLHTSLKDSVVGKVLYLNHHYLNEVNILPF